MPANININPDLFPPPENRDIKIWRYMDFSKFVSMLDAEALFFCRADLFEDPYEGSITTKDFESRSKNITPKPIPPSEEIQIRAELNKNARQWVYINCWHINEHESAAMWELYAKTSEAIAIQTTFEKLHNCFDKNIVLSPIRYVDYEKEHIPNENGLWQYFHKRKSFEHEKELRCVKLELNNPNMKKAKENNINNIYDFIRNNNNPKKGEQVRISLQNLIHKIHISPTAPSWFLGLVSNIVDKYDLNIDIVQSSLSNDPIF